MKVKKKPAAKKKTAKKKTAAKSASTPTVDPDRAEAAAEVLQAVFLHEKHFDLESEIVLEGGRPIAHEDAEGHLWITVKLHVPRSTSTPGSTARTWITPTTRLTTRRTCEAPARSSAWVGKYPIPQRHDGR